MASAIVNSVSVVSKTPGAPMSNRMSRSLPSTVSATKNPLADSDTRSASKPIEKSPTVTVSLNVMVPSCSIVPPTGAKGSAVKLKSVLSLMANPTWKFSEKGSASLSTPVRASPVADSIKSKSRKTLVTPDSTKNSSDTGLAATPSALTCSVISSPYTRRSVSTNS